MHDIATLKLSGTKVVIIANGSHNAVVGSRWRTSGMMAGAPQDLRVLLSRGPVSCWVPASCFRIV